MEVTGSVVKRDYYEVKGENYNLELIRINGSSMKYRGREGFNR